MGTRFLEMLLRVSEKAANIARVVRQDEHLFKLLVQEKKGSEKNPRLHQDFKTLADVLIQETVKHDIGIQFPEIADHILGEESNSFSNILGDTITVEVQESEAATAALLSTVLGGDTQAAEVLAAEVHRDLSCKDVELSHDLPELCLPLEQCGIWIDPIDSTAEYIRGEEVKSVENMYQSGLRCVTVLIGVFNRETGQPLVGVVNQPFHTQLGTQWCGKCHWGVKLDDVSHTSPSLPKNASQSVRKVVVLSSNESTSLKSHLASAGYTVAEAAGAGYKQLCVMFGDADVFVFSKGSTSKWDTCGPHAILQALGGGVIAYKKIIEGSDPIQNCEISYCEDDFTHSNSDGLIAFKDTAVVTELVEVLKKL